MKANKNHPIYLVTIFISAFLLFQVQPIISKLILPWFGGAPAVWSACMLFFQVLLLGGYTYAHLITSKTGPGIQVLIHSCILAGAGVLVLFQTIIPSSILKPTAEENPLLRILLILFLSIGLPYFALAATSPLLQYWYSRSFQKKEPYLLFALSNAGSLLALITYPFLVEPILTLHKQSQVWGICFVIFITGCGIIMWFFLQGVKHPAGLDEQASSEFPAGQKPAISSDATPTSGPEKSPEQSATRPRQGFFSSKLRWIFLPFLSTSLLMAITNQLCVDIASGPFMWVVPLSIYLITFIITFSSLNRIYHRTLYGIALTISAISLAFVLPDQIEFSLGIQILVHCMVLFFGCGIAHGELYRLRPDVRYLTKYYLYITLGGALGGIAIALVAPLLFSDFYELPLTCCALIILLSAITIHNQAEKKRSGKFFVIAGITLIFCISTAGAFTYEIWVSLRNVRAASRNFFGVVRVHEYYVSYPKYHQYSLLHGTTEHGAQFIAPDRCNEPTTYFSITSGIGITLSQFPRNQGIRVGIAGLGVGTIAAYAQPRDTFTFFEINPAVTGFSERSPYFTYIQQAIARGAQVSIVPGDARLSIEQQVAATGGGLYDVLVLDAFSSDAIPMHLLTREAFNLYFRMMKTKGVLLVNLTNRHVDLSPVIATMAAHFGYRRISITNGSQPDNEIQTATWNILTKNDHFINTCFKDSVRNDPIDFKKYLWTDDFCNLWDVVTR